MRLKKLVWHIFPANLLVTVGSLMAILWYGSGALGNFYINWIATDLEERAYFIEEQVTKLVNTNKSTELNAFCRRVGRKASTRITVIRPSGTVLADSDENPAKMNNHKERPEIQRAMSGSSGKELRLSPTLGIKMIYVAIPLPSTISPENNNQPFVLRMAMPVSAIDDALESLRLNIFLSALIVAIIAMLAAILVSRRISKPLEQMTKGAEEFAQGNFTNSLVISPNCSQEVGSLTTAMNSMANKLQERFKTIVRQRNELQTILASMADAILVINTKKQIITFNTSAANLFGVSEAKAIGSNTLETVRNIHIEKLVDTTLASRETVTGEITLKKGTRDLFLHCKGVQLLESNSNSFGAVMTFSEVTHIRRLENIRREFVANVSHELMTPLTSIKGFAETILDSDLIDKEQTEKFLRIILRQSERLQTLVDDLLKLSKIEKEIEHHEINPVPSNVHDVLVEAIQVCSHRATEKEIDIQLDCPRNLIAPLEAHLMEQAIANLLVNAIKYSMSSSRIYLGAKLCSNGNDAEKVMITVKDNGIGVGKKHLPRLFERFYRSDKARSKKLGGTGLGLAIVKHIIQAHNGTVEVESEVGKGTIFTICLPVSLPT